MRTTPSGKKSQSVPQAITTTRALASLAVLVAIGAVTSGSYADEPPRATTAPTTPAQCVASGPELEDRSAPLRTALPSTIVGLTRREFRALPNPIPRKLSAQLTAGDTLIGSLNAKGWIGQKSIWRRDRRAAGYLHVSARRIDAPGGRFRASLDRQYGGSRYSPFVPGSLNFSEPGCWRVKGRAGDVRVTYVVLVRRPHPGEFSPYLP
jgi:hypothetical protein